MMNDDRELDINEIKKNLAEANVKKRHESEFGVIEERSIETDEEELECREFQDSNENIQQMYIEVEEMKSPVLQKSSTSYKATKSFLDSDFIDISTIKEEVVSNRVLVYFKKRWWLVFPDGKFKIIWDQIVGVFIVGRFYSDIRGPCAPC